jgi:hypothetical protein
MISTARPRLALCAVILACGLRRAGSRCEPGAIESFEVSPRTGLILLPVTIGGERYNFALDTGSERTAFDHRLRPRLGEPVGETLVNGLLVAKTYRCPDARLGSMDLVCESPVDCIDLNGLRERQGEDAYGIIGMDWLSRRVFEFDPDEGRITFLRPISEPPPGTVAVHVKDVKGLPYVEAEIAGLGRTDFVVDTGYYGSFTLLEGDIQRLTEAKRIQLSGVGQLNFLGGKMMSSYGNVDWLDFGGARLERPTFYGAALSLRTLGMDIWSRYVTIFDLPNHVIYLRKAKSIGEPWVDDLSGLKLLRRGGETIVRSVAKQAEPLAIRKGDVILSLDRKPASDFSLWEISRLFSREGSRVILTIRRGREKRDVPIVLSRSNR